MLHLGLSVTLKVWSSQNPFAEEALVSLDYILSSLEDGRTVHGPAAGSNNSPSEFMG